MVPAAVLLLATLAAYQGAHYATAGIAFEPGCCNGFCAHAIKGHLAADWIENCFWLANEIDHIIDVDPYQKPIH
jgi:hypothetical protein